LWSFISRVIYSVGYTRTFIYSYVFNHWTQIYWRTSISAFNLLACPNTDYSININTVRHRTSALLSVNQTALDLVSDVIHALMAFMLSDFFALVIFSLIYLICQSTIVLSAKAICKINWHDNSLTLHQKSCDLWRVILVSGSSHRATYASHWTGI
jgi:hypothetical protein